MERRVRDALGKTQLRDALAQHLRVIEDWKPSRNSKSKILNGVAYEYDDHNVKIHLKDRLTFQIVEVSRPLAPSAM